MVQRVVVVTVWQLAAICRQITLQVDGLSLGHPFWLILNFSPLQVDRARVDPLHLFARFNSCFSLLHFFILSRPLAFGFGGGGDPLGKLAQHASGILHLALRKGDFAIVDEIAEHLGQTLAKGVVPAVAVLGDV